MRTRQMYDTTSISFSPPADEDQDDEDDEDDEDDDDDELKEPKLVYSASERALDE